MTAGEIDVVVVYALPVEQAVVRLQVAAGTTVEQAIVRCGLLQRYPEVNLAVNRVGVFGKIVTRDTLLQAGDRVEIYRPLVVEPKAARRRRADLKKIKKENR